MQTSDTVQQIKRHYKKIISQNTAIMLKEYAEENHPKDELFIRNMIRQIKCSGRIEEYDNGDLKSLFCGQRTCLVCNSIRLSKFLNKYLDHIEKLPIKYHLVLSIRNPNEDELKTSISRMFKFFNQSSIKKNKEFKALNKKLMFIRSFETTFNIQSKTYHNHFHCLIGGEDENEVKKYGEIIIEYWLKYFGELADIRGQYLEPQEKTILENFKYLFKLKDIVKPVLPMAYNIVKVTRGKRLFVQKNILKRKSYSQLIDNKKDNRISFKKNKNITEKIDTEKILNEAREALNEMKKGKKEPLKRIATYNYYIKAENWVNEETGEVLITDQKIKEAREEFELAKNEKKLREYFRSKIPPKPPSISNNPEDQLEIF